MSFPKALIGDLTSIRTGKLDANAAVSDGQYPFFTCAVDPLRIDKYAYDCNAILIAGNGDLNVKHYKGKFEAYQRTYILEVSERAKLDSRYLYYFMSKYVEKLRELSIGGVIKYIKLGMLTDAEIPLPPLAEQKRIAAILDKADAIRRKRQAAIKLANDFLRATFLDLFGDPVTNPKGWEVIPLENLTVIDAPMVDPRKEEFVNLWHIGPDRIEKNTGKILEAKTAKEDRLISGKFLFNEEHVLYTKIRPYLRKVALPDFVGLCSADMYPVSPETQKITREYLWSILVSEAFVKYTEDIPSRASIPKINRKEFGAYQCMLPPLKTQEKYSAILKRTNRLKEEYMHSGDSEDLFNSLTQRAFRGEL